MNCFTRSVLLLFVLYSFCLPPLSVAQTASIAGTVTDTRMAVVPHAKMPVQNQELKASRSIETDGSGTHRSTNLPPGTYDVVAEKALFGMVEYVHIDLTVEPLQNLDATSGSIAGTVRDLDGVAVPGVRVTLAGPNNAVDQVVTADSRGAFTFAELVPGIYRVKIAEAGLEQSVTAEVVLGAGEGREVPIVGTRIPTVSTTIDVVATLNEVAQAQVEAQEKQRVLGFLPNYYSSYIWDAAPMTPKLKFKLSLRSTTDPVTFLVTAGLAGVEQKHNTFPGYGQGSEGYAKRFGAAYADTMVSKMVSRAILPTILHQDPRYFYRGSGSIRSRIFYALAAAVICRGDNGRLQPNYSQVLGNFAASGISNLYRAPGDRTASLTFRNGLIMTGSGAVENLLREFFSRKVTSNVPAFANGKP